MGQRSSKTVVSADPWAANTDVKMTLLGKPKKKRGCLGWLCAGRRKASHAPPPAQPAEMVLAKEYCESKDRMKWLRNRKGRKAWYKVRNTPEFEEFCKTPAIPPPSPYQSIIASGPPGGLDCSTYAPAFSTLPVPQPPPVQKSWIPKLTFPVIEDPTASWPTLPISQAAWGDPPAHHNHNHHHGIGACRSPW